MRTRSFILAALLAALTAVGAFLRIPLPPSAITLQFFFTAMAGLLLGPKYGALSQLIYVGLGLIGLPVFTMGGGLGCVMQPTFGFLLGLIPAAWLIGLLTRSDCSPKRVVLACIAGLALLYAVGLPYMGLILNVYLAQNWTLTQVLYRGMLLFLPGDSVKILVCALLAPRLRRSLDNIH